MSPMTTTAGNRDGENKKLDIGVTRVLYGEELFMAMIFNLVWLGLHIVCVSPIIYFNNPERQDAL